MARKEQQPGPQGMGAPSPGDFSETRLWVEGARKGDQRAFEELWLRFRPGVEILVGSMAYRNPDSRFRANLIREVDDILSQVMARAFGNFDRFQYRGPGSLLAWLSAITRNEVRRRVEYWMAERRNPRRERTLNPGEGTDSRERPLPSPAPGPATQVDLVERRRRVAAAMAFLDERWFTILHMHFFAGAGWAEIARAVGSPSPDAVRMECFGRVLPAFAAAYAKLGPGQTGSS